MLVLGLVGVSSFHFELAKVSDTVTVWNSQEGVVVSGTLISFGFRPSQPLVQISGFVIEIVVSRSIGSQAPSLNLSVQLNGLYAVTEVPIYFANGEVRLLSFEVKDPLILNNLRVGTNNMRVDSDMLMHSLSLIVEYYAHS